MKRPSILDRDRVNDNVLNRQDADAGRIRKLEENQLTKAMADRRYFQAGSSSSGLDLVNIILHCEVFG